MNLERRRRSGFSLVELLAVMAIMGILMGISIGAFYRIKIAESVRATEATLRRINTVLDKRWTAVVDKAAEDARTGAIPDAITTYADGDPDRARTLWTYMLLKNEFPTTVAEAKTDITVNGYTLSHRAVFNPLSASTTPELESAMCLYISLIETGNRGEVFQGDIPASDFGTARAFVDSWGRPIAFARMTFAPEVDVVGSPYLAAGTVNHDPIDPKGLLNTNTAVWTSAQCNSFWSIMTTNHIPYSGSSNYAITYPAAPGKNWVSSAFSAGPNGTAPGFNPSTRDGFGSFLYGADDPGYDNIVSFRLRREGSKGN